MDVSKAAQTTMHSSSGSSSQQQDLPNLTGLSVSTSFSDPRLQTALLCHPSISQDQQVVARLLQTSKELQAAVAQHGVGQLHVAVHARTLRQMTALALWVQNHASLIYGIDIGGLCISPCSCLNWVRGLSSCSCRSGGSGRAKHWAPAAVSELASVMQQTKAAGILKLVSFSLSGVQAGVDILKALPSVHLTRLCIELDYSNPATYGTMREVAALSRLRHLKLINVGRGVGPADALAALAASLPQLTQLQIGPVACQQLCCLQLLLQQQLLQQLHLTVDLEYEVQQLCVLADWLKQRRSIVSSLEILPTRRLPGPVQLLDGGGRYQIDAALVKAVNALAAALESKAVRAAAAAAAAAGDGPPPPELQLQSLSVPSDWPGDLITPLLQMLPAGRMLRLQCHYPWYNAAQVSVLCGLTALRSCDLALGSVNDVVQRSESYQTALAALSALQEMTQLRLRGVTSGQLQALELPQLQELVLQLADKDPGEALQLGHLTALQRLTVLARAGTPLLCGDSLPPNLRELVWPDTPPAGFKQGGCSLRPLLRLNSLAKLHLPYSDADPVALLSSLRSLQEVTFSCRSKLGPEVPPAWRELPITALDVHVAHRNVTALPAGFVLQLTDLHKLTCLSVSVYKPLGLRRHDDAAEETSSMTASPLQWASVLSQLPRLQLLELSGFGMQCETISTAADLDGYGSTAAAAHRYVESTAALLSAIGGLQDLSSLRLVLPLGVHHRAAYVLWDVISQLLPSSLASRFRVSAGDLRIM